MTPSLLAQNYLLPIPYSVNRVHTRDRDLVNRSQPLSTRTLLREQLSVLNPIPSGLPRSQSACREIAPRLRSTRKSFRLRGPETRNPAN
jgi:hypothetical protein